jgi:hypothetical protein
MPELTIFTAPKPFTNPHVAIIQRNAIRSWLQMGPAVEVCLVGQETGLAEVAKEYGVAHLPDVARNERGTPLVSSIFDLARRHSYSPLLCYVNADILMYPDFVDQARKVAAQVENFLVVGQRWDLDGTELLDFSPGWDQRLRADVAHRGRLHLPAGSDYFVFPRHIFTDMPAFAIGRAGWDNWMLYQALKQRWHLIDATASLDIVHQNHDYSHLPGGKPHYQQEETFINAALGGGMRNMFILLDAPYQLVEGKVRPARLSRARILRWVERWLRPEREQGWRWALFLRIQSWRLGADRKQAE